jgi:NAD+ kinase
LPWGSTVRALLVYKKSTYQLYVLERRNKAMQALIDNGEESIEVLRLAHETHIAAVDSVHHCLKQAGFEVRRTYRARLGENLDYDLIVTVGGDGTLLDVSHHLSADVPLLGVNSDPANSVGLLAAAQVQNLPAVLDKIAQAELKPRKVARLRLCINGELYPVLALNDVLVSHSNPAATSRYNIGIASLREQHKSSGIWIASAIGSTAAMRSAGGCAVDIDDDRLQFLVREPYEVEVRKQLRGGFLDGSQTFEVISEMRGGCIYIDGPHTRIPFGLGTKLEIDIEPASLSLYFSTSSLQRRCAFVTTLGA